MRMLQKSHERMEWQDKFIWVQKILQSMQFFHNIHFSGIFEDPLCIWTSSSFVSKYIYLLIPPFHEHFWKTRVHFSKRNKATQKLKRREVWNKLVKQEKRIITIPESSESWPRSQFRSVSISCREWPGPESRGQPLWVFQEC